MLSRLVLVMLVLGTGDVTQACPDAEMAREVALALFKDRVLAGMGLEAPPESISPGKQQGPQQQTRKSKRAAGDKKGHEKNEEPIQIIMFPAFDSDGRRVKASDGETASRQSFYFQPSGNNKELTVISAHFWFYAGPATNSTAPLYILTEDQPLDKMAEAPVLKGLDGWNIYELDAHIRHTAAYSEPFMLQVRCADCRCNSDDPEKAPFLHLHARPRVTGRWPRSAATFMPWSPSAINVLQRPSQQQQQQQQQQSSNCWRDEIDISFDELGWGHWIVHPKAVAFSYCHGNCSAPNSTAASLGMRQCCAPVPETMRSLNITTTSDGGYSFQCEVLPNIIPEECHCF